MEDKKTLEILIVEDNPKHLADAKTAMDKAIAEGYKINVSYASTYVDAEKTMNEKKYDGIITDIFFPYDDVQRKGYPKGYAYEATICCRQELGEHIEPYLTGDRTDTPWGHAADDWLYGKTMHPTGVMIAKKALNSNTAVIFCTDTNHHGDATQPIFSYSFDEIGPGQMVDDVFSETKGVKDWKKALDNTIRFYAATTQGFKNIGEYSSRKTTEQEIAQVTAVYESYKPKN